MKFEVKLFKSFFFPFLITILLSTLIVTIFLRFFTDNYLDKRSAQYIINIEKQISKKYLNSADILVSSMLLKIQAGLNELINFYLKIGNDLLNDEFSHELQTDHLIAAVKIDEDYCDLHFDETESMAAWYIDGELTEDNYDSNQEGKKQVISFSNIIHNIDATLEVNKPKALTFFFYFEKTELYASYPLSFDCIYDFAYIQAHYPYYTYTSCVDENGEYYTVYKIKCAEFFIHMMNAKSNLFDNNYSTNYPKTILINNFYYTIIEDAEQEFTICIEFDDPISQGKGYACSDVNYNDLIKPLDEINSFIKGYFLISNVGFNNVFYFPQSTSSGKIPVEYVFNWMEAYKLKEKRLFKNNINKIFSSNYNKYIINNSMYDEVYVNGKNSSEQYFYINGEKFNYSIFPLILDNVKGYKEHVFSIIYIYNNEILLQDLNKYNTSAEIRIFLELLFFIIFGSSLLYIIYLTFNTLSKYIVIPIKNVNYMLKGINIGGKDRLKYLNYLKSKQDESLE